MHSTQTKYFTCILTSVFFFFCVPVFSQKTTDYKKKKFTFHIEKKDTSIKFDVFAVNPKVNPNEAITYNWYKEDKILQTKGGYDGRLLDGQYVSFYANKNLREKGRFRKGVKKGKWLKWHTNGKLNEVAHWRQGFKNGKYVLYNDEGQKMLACTFLRDKMNGKLTSYDKGKVLSKTKYRRGVEIPIKISKGKVRDFDARQKTKTSFREKIKCLFKKKEKTGDKKHERKDKKKPAKEKKQKEKKKESSTSPKRG